MLNCISSTGDDDVEVNLPDYGDDPADLQLLQDVGKWVLSSLLQCSKLDGKFKIEFLGGRKFVINEKDLCMLISTINVGIKEGLFE